MELLCSLVLIVMLGGFIWWSSRDNFDEAEKEEIAHFKEQGYELVRRTNFRSNSRYFWRNKNGETASFGEYATLVRSGKRKDTKADW